MKRDRRNGAERQCLTPTVQNPGAVKLARAVAGMEQQQLAAAVGINKSYMSEIENGHRSVKPPTLAKIADALGCKTAPLINPAYAEMLGCDVGTIAALAREDDEDDEPEAVPEAA